jgi:tripartite-type tricarboxylate transporter receptor subunit TctC
MTGRRLALLVAAGAAVWSVAAEAQPYPARPITIVVPYAAGGVFDTMARIIGARMGELLGQSVIVENVTSAAGIIGVQHVINAKPGRLYGAARECWHPRLQSIDIPKAPL